jgi:PD-(D/E)XK nuclease superfamily protein
VLTTNQKGLLAEATVIRECVKLGVGVARPLDDERYDLILDLRPRLLRVQCKWATQYDDVMVVRLYSSRRGPNGSINRAYGADEVDAFAVYCQGTDTCYFLGPEFAGSTQVLLRLAPTRNNQRQRIRWASDYEFDATIRAIGAVAQLGERLAGSQKVRGSIPLGSIEKPP